MDDLKSKFSALDVIARILEEVGVGKWGHIRFFGAKSSIQIRPYR